jgi:chromosomal replication initiation ATPase DnaA
MEKTMIQEKIIPAKTTNPNITSESIDQAVCVFYNTTMEVLIQRTHKREVCEPRSNCMALRQLILGEYQRVAGENFNKDHATAYHAKKKFYEFYTTEHTFRVKIRAIMEILTLPSDYFDRL